MDFSFNHLLIGLVVISYSASQLLFSLKFNVQIAGVLNRSKNTAASLENIMNIGSTAMLAAFLPAVAYLVEQELSLKPYLLIVSISVTVSGLSQILLRKNLAFVTAYFLTVIRAYQRDRSMPKAIFFVGVRLLDFKTSILNARDSLSKIKDQFSLKYFLASSVLTIPVSTGFFISFLLALLFPDNRLLLSQTSILIHGFGQFFMALYVVPAVMSSFDISDSSKVWGYKVHSMLIGRECAFCIVGALMFLCYLIF